MFSYVMNKCEVVYRPYNVVPCNKILILLIYEDKVTLFIHVPSYGVGHATCTGSSCASRCITAVHNRCFVTGPVRQFGNSVLLGRARARYPVDSRPRLILSLIGSGACLIARCTSVIALTVKLAHLSEARSAHSDARSLRSLLSGAPSSRSQQLARTRY